MAGAFELDPLTPWLGAEISRVEVRRLNTAGFAELHRAWLE